MKTRLFPGVLLLYFCLFNLVVHGQYTPYDDLPGVCKSCKPGLNSDIPAWAEKLYRYPANFYEIQQGFEKYIALHPGQKSAIIRYYKIWSRAIEPLTMPDGFIHMPDLNQYYHQRMATQNNVGGEQDDKPFNASDWTFLGPGETFWLNESGSSTPPSSCPWQVNVYSFDVSLSDNSVIYCGTETGFVNKTTNKGMSWQLSGQNYPFGGAVTAVAIHPSNADIVYVAAGNQVHKTSDGGATWVPLLPVGNLFSADRLKIDPVNPLKIYAAGNSGVYVTEDGGATWTNKWTFPAYDIEIKPDDNSQVYALTKSGGKFSVIMSLDGGGTFQAMTGFPNNITESSGGLLAMSPANPNVMLAILLSANNTPYLLKGTRSGAAWTWLLQATGGSSSFPMDNGQGYFDLVLDISPLDENLILVGTTTLYKSVNGGSTFSAVGGYSGSFSIHPDIQDIKMMPNGETWVSTDGGMNYTTDNFTSLSNYFPRINGLVGSDMWGFDQGWNEDFVVGGRYHNGNTAIADFYQPKSLRMGGAESPTGWVLQGKSRHTAFDDLGNGWILPLTAEGKPQGRFIFSKYPNMDEYGGRRSNLVHHPNYYGTLYLGEGNGFWKSSDMGVSWNLLYNFPAKVRYLQISYCDPEIFYADILGVGLCKSIDGGLNWEQKPALTSPPYGNSNWKGKLFFAISPTDSQVIYACLQNGTWSADIGKVFRSVDGGESWEDWTGTLSEYMKCLVVQPDSAGNDLVYLFTNATNGKVAKVYSRRWGSPDWSLFSNGYPAGMTVNLALPFFRDSKLRVAGNGGVWESPMADSAYVPIINPWVEKAHYDCMSDTLFFDDHSIADHSGVTWNWTIAPQPVWIDNPNVRNPRVVLGNPGAYDVTVTVTKNGHAYTKSVENMVTATTCPSIYDCNNPADIPKNGWSLVYADSEELNDPGLATMSFDGDPSTIWHTRWSTGNDPYPHEIQIGMGERYRVSRFTYLPRQDGENGRIQNYELFISNDMLDWGPPAYTGQFANSSAPQHVEFDTVKVGRYFRLVALSEVNGSPWASAAEFSLKGCVDWPAGFREDEHKDIAAFPVPTCGLVTISLPDRDPLDYKVFSSSGLVVAHGVIEHHAGTWNFDFGLHPAGFYLVHLSDPSGTIYRVKVLKN